MVKVGSMKRAKRILLIASVLVVSFSGADASIFRHRKVEKQPVTASAETAPVSLIAIEVDSSRVLLQTSGNPAYTSYSPTPGVFVVDLTATKAPSLTIPTALPAGLISLAADEAVEMGNRLTRVTFRLSQPLTPEVSASDHGVAVKIAGGSSTAAAETAVPEQKAEASKSEAPHLEPIAEPVTPVAEPVARSESLQFPKARTLKRVDASGSGDSLEVRLAADGAIEYKSFVLENPTRVVIDLDGVRNAVVKSTLALANGPVKRVRVGQFKGQPDPVTRVVLDLDKKIDYSVARDGDFVRITFGAKPPASNPVEPVAVVAAPAPAKPSEPAMKDAKAAKGDIPSQVPVIAENATWKMPDSPAKEAHPVIRGPADQAPPPTSKRTTKTTQPATAAPAPAGTAPTPENVFSEPAPAGPAPRQQVLTGGAPAAGKTLSVGEKVYSGEPISLNLKDADIKDVLRTFAQLTGLNMAIDPQVSGSVTVDFVDVPWDQALELILRQNSLAYKLEGNVMRVGTIDRLAAETVATRRLAEEERLNVPLQTVSFKLSYARANEVQGLLREIASPRARIIVDARTNQLIVSEIPQYLQTMRNLIDSIDIPTRQVVIEARIVEASKVFQQQWGFVWGFNGVLDPALGTGTGLIFPNRVGYKAGPFSFGPGNPVLDLTLTDVLGTFNLDLALNASEFEGLVKVISAPKVMTQDNQPAEIRSGFQIPFQTRVNFTTTISYVDATLSLTVTPQITEAGTVIMDIAVQKNEPSTGLAIEGAAGTPLSTRTARTRLMVRDGGTALIGGIYKVTDNKSQTRLPFLHQIPVIGYLFKTHNISSTHDELLIFITPRIVRGA